ncbi:MAG: D-aminoacyl-tRNA deacylase [Bacteroidota bacterium]
MRAVIQRVSGASISTESGHTDSIDKGLLILLGIEEKDSEDDIKWLSKKIANLRIFDDDEGVMNLSLKDINGQSMVVSQFTLHASTKKGNRPSYIKAAKPQTAIPLYEKFIEIFKIENKHKPATGVFGDHMDINLVNDGPVTIIIDSKNRE